MNNLSEIKFKDGKRHQAGMTVPEDFFVKFQSNLEKEIDKIEPQKLSIAPAPRRNMMVRWMSVAACAVVLVVAGVFALDFNSDKNILENNAVADNQVDGEYSETEQLIISSFDDLYLYDLYCDAGF